MTKEVYLVKKKTQKETKPKPSSPIKTAHMCIMRYNCGRVRSKWNISR